VRFILCTSHLNKSEFKKDVSTTPDLSQQTGEAAKSGLPPPASCPEGQAGTCFLSRGAPPRVASSWHLGATWADPEAWSVLGVLQILTPAMQYVETSGVCGPLTVALQAAPGQSPLISNSLDASPSLLQTKASQHNLGQEGRPGLSTGDADPEAKDLRGGRMCTRCSRPPASARLLSRLLPSLCPGSARLSPRALSVTQLPDYFRLREPDRGQVRHVLGLSQQEQVCPSAKAQQGEEGVQRDLSMTWWVWPNLVARLQGPRPPQGRGGPSP
ncbi:hypothetical protein EI555_002521, partial [Monodon monoceros]